MDIKYFLWWITRTPLHKDFHDAPMVGLIGAIHGLGLFILGSILVDLFH